LRAYAIAIPSFQLGTVTLAGWLVGGKSCLSVRAINRSASGFPNAVVFCCVRAGQAGSRAYAPTSCHRMLSVCLSVTLLICGHIGWSYFTSNYTDN